MRCSSNQPFVSVENRIDYETDNAVERGGVGGLTHNSDKCEGGWVPPDFNGGVISAKVASQVTGSTS